jgi:hypothetical protein
LGVVTFAWLERRQGRPRARLSRFAQEGVDLALLIAHTPLSVADIARLKGWNERRVRRRLARARAELEASERACACGCDETLPPSATAARRYVDDTHKKRAYRRRRGAPSRGRASERLGALVSPA